MSSAESLRSGKYDDIREFHSGINLLPFSEQPDNKDAVLAIQMIKLAEEHDEIIAAFRDGEIDHLPEELIDLAYVSLGIVYMLDGHLHEPQDETTALPQLVADGATLQLNIGAAISDISVRHAQAQAAHQQGTEHALVTELDGLALASLGLINAMGLDTDRLWGDKHTINITKYDPTMYASLRQNGYDHQGALAVLKQTWPNRRQVASVPLAIDIDTGYLVV